MTAELVAITMTFVVHVVGAVFLVWAMIGDEDARDRRDWWPRDDRGDDGPPPTPGASSGPGGLPLPGADPARARMRAPGRLGDAYPRPPRRPAHPPAPDRERDPA
ncbi:MAG TPA: hypothetical protein VGV40_10785 [Solirubrobacteraceae bacterium]|nr:hypothetical protein [Solirubrobacteraceae bacterium]